MSIQHDMQARQLADRAQLLFDAGMLSDAAFAAEQSLEFDGDNLITRVLLARIELARGRGKQALLALDHHARCAPDQLQSPEMLLMRAQAYVQAGLDRDAQAVLEGLMQNYPDDCRAYRLAVGMHLRGGRTHHAANLLRDLARTQPNDQAVRRTLASLIADDTPDEAIELLAASVGSGDDAIVQLSLARAYVRDERYADAEPMYADLLAEKPHDSRLWLEAGELADRRGSRDTAISRLRRAAELAVMQEDVAAAHRSLALAAMHAGDFQTAVIAWRNVHRADDTAVEPLVALQFCGVTLRRDRLVRIARRRLAAAGHTDTARRKAAATIWPHAATGEVLRNVANGDTTTRRRDITDAPSTLTAMLHSAARTLADHAQQHPDRADTHYHLARTRHALRDYKGASHALADAIEINPRYNAARVFALEVIGDRKAA